MKAEPCLMLRLAVLSLNSNVILQHILHIVHMFIPYYLQQKSILLQAKGSFFNGSNIEVLG